ncbi:MAG TPA: SAM-dependent chlorinase/fluorinase [Gemmatimonadaceae bacterium]|nr:SAM-dependent chlorinase/fluorinase [Gemmatimonadaceae bacterium]
MRPLITLLTDFGTADGYVAEVKGVLLSLVPDAQIVDASHEIPPHDVELARLTLAKYWRRFPERTVHLVIVDPGVGSARAVMAVESEGRFLVGPDNGVLSPALLARGARAVSLAIPSDAAPTFQGRDVLAPAVARLALGEELEFLGLPHEHPFIRRTAESHQRADGTIDGEVIAIDRFGNAITNLIARPGASVDVSGRLLPLVRTYADVPSGSLCALISSTGLIEVSVRDGNGAQAAGLHRGSRVILHPSRER